MSLVQQFKHAIQQMALSAEKREQFYLALRDIVDNEIAISDALRIMEKDLGEIKDPLSKVINEILVRMSGAYGRAMSFAEALVGDHKREIPALIPEVEAMLIRAGEESGNLVLGFESAADLIKKKRELMAHIKSSMAKPVFLILMFVGILQFFAYKIVPSFYMIEPNKYMWPSITLTMATVADNATLITSLIIGIIVASIIIIKGVAPYWRGDMRDYFDKYIPPFSILAKVNGAMMLSSLSGFLQAGVPFTDAVKVMMNTGTPYMRWQYARINAMMKKGVSPSEAISALPLVPKRFHWIINVYRLMDDVAASMKVVSEKVLDSVSKTVSAFFEKVLANMALVLVASGILMTMGGMMSLVLTKL